MKVREVITLKGWVNGSGWSFEQTYSDKIIEVADIKEVTTIKNVDWDWYETPEENPEDSGEDAKIIVEFYTEDADIIEDKPIASYETWESELWEERNNTLVE